MKRALRRHHRARLIAKRTKNIWWVKENLKAGVEFSGVIANTPTPCSCHGCRNPRHSNHYSGSEKLTMQERRAMAADQQQVDRWRHNSLRNWYFTD